LPTLADLAGSVAERLKARDETVAVVETSGGGLISAALLAVPGASAYYVGGAVTYTGTAREVFLGIDLADHHGMRSASEPYATLIAATVRERLGTTWGISETGASGPTGNSYGDAAGHTCVAVEGPMSAVATLETGIADRERNMTRFAERCLTLFLETLRSA
jgi:nicotinamide-nucleotide amidase